MSRTVTPLAHGVIAVVQRTTVRGVRVATEVSGPACIYAEVHVARGRVSYLRDDMQVVAPQRFRIFLPPFAIAQVSLHGCDVRSWGVAFHAPEDLELPCEPMVAPIGRQTPVRSVRDILDRATPVLGDSQPVGRTSNAVDLAARAKQTLDREYSTASPLTALARRLHTSAAELSRAFARSYGLPPVRYRHHLRVIDAMTRLAAGSAPLDVCHDVGFDDLSRFYKVFGRVACATPGSIRPTKNAKTRT